MSSSSPDPVPTALSLPPIADIRLFFDAPTSRASNHSDNATRERILLSMFQMPSDHEYLQKCEKWRAVYDKLTGVLSDIRGDSTHPHGRPVQMAGGRANNYDFVLDGHLIEFKFGAQSFTSVPQILSIQTRWDHDPFLGPNIPSISVSPYHLRNIRCEPRTYTQHFYYKYLPQIVPRSMPLVPPDVYRYHVIRVTAAHPFFATLKRTQSPESQRISDQSIHDYLSALRAIEPARWDWRHLLPMIEKQNNKIFMFWDPASLDFHIHKPDIRLSPNTAPYFRRGRQGLFNTVVLPLDDESGELTCLLRWKNHKGVQNPAWQIKYIPYPMSPVSPLTKMVPDATD